MYSISCVRNIIIQFVANGKVRKKVNKEMYQLETIRTPATVVNATPKVTSKELQENPAQHCSKCGRVTRATPQPRRLRKQRRKQLLKQIHEKVSL